MASSAWAGDDLRYSRASHVITNGESLIFTERLLGHRRRTTNCYTHLDATMREVAGPRYGGNRAGSCKP